MILVYGSDETTRNVIVRRLVDAGIDRERIGESAIGELSRGCLAARLVVAVGRDADDARRTQAALQREWPDEPASPPTRLLAVECGKKDEGVLSIEGVPSPWLRALIESEFEGALKRRELAEARSELERFLYIISHDLLAPVRSIAGFTTLVLRRAGETLDSGLADMLDMTKRSAERLQAMVIGLRDVSRVHTRAGEIGSHSLTSIVNQVLEERRGEIEASGATIELGELCSVLADSEQLHDLIDELIVNAITHTARDTRPEVSVSARQRADHVEVRIADRGATLDERSRELVFEPFHQIERREDAGHPGVGLTLCRAIAKRHGGTLVVEGREGGGNVFVLSMPRSARDRTSVLA